MNYSVSDSNLLPPSSSFIAPEGTRQSQDGYDYSKIEKGFIALEKEIGALEEQIKGKVGIQSEFLALEEPVKGKKWNARAIDVLQEWDIRLEEKMPNHLLQRQLDHFGEQITALIEKGKPFNKWIDHNGMGAWYKQLATFIVKLPVRAIRNVLRLTYTLVKNLVYGFVHPIKALNHAAQFLLQFLNELAKPEFYTKSGAGILGASLGNLAITGGYGLPSYIGLILGGGLLVGGLTAGAIQAAVEADKGKRLDAVGNALWAHLKSVPEVLLTGFIMGLLVGSIQKALNPPPAPPAIASTETIKQWINQHYLPDNHLPNPTSITIDPFDGHFTLTWSGADLNNNVIAMFDLKQLSTPSYLISNQMTTTIYPMTQTGWTNTPGLTVHQVFGQTSGAYGVNYYYVNPEVLYPPPSVYPFPAVPMDATSPTLYVLKEGE